MRLRALNVLPFSEARLTFVVVLLPLVVVVVVVVVVVLTTSRNKTRARICSLCAMSARTARVVVCSLPPQLWKMSKSPQS